MRKTLRRKGSGERRNEETTAQLTRDARPKPIIAHFLLALLIASVVFLRVVKVDSVPPGSYIDEASIGYNAYSILQTGADEHGVSFPLFFKAFGEYKNPVFIYSLVPLIKVFDLSIWTIRFGAALFGLGTAIFLALIVKETIGGIPACASCFVLASLTPWLFTLSRISFEVITFPFFLALAWWSWIKASKSNSFVWFLLSWSAWGVGIFTYSTARLMVPVLVLVLVGCYFFDRRTAKARCLLGSIPFILCLLLLFSWSIQHPGSLTDRFSRMSIWNDHSDIMTVVGRFFSRYLNYLSPAFLFVGGDPNLRSHTGFCGELFVSTFPPLFAGLAYAWQHRQEPLERFTLLAFLLFPLAASLTQDASHALRAVNAMPFIVVLMMWGFKELWELLAQRRSLIVLFTVFAALETTWFYYDYFNSYAYRSGIWFNAGLPQAITIALKNNEAGIYYSPLAFRGENFESAAPYIQFLFFGKLNPSVYHKQGLSGFHIFPYKNGMNLPKGSILLLKDADELFTASGKEVVIENNDRPPPDSELIDKVQIFWRGISNSTVYRIYRIV